MYFIFTVKIKVKRSGKKTRQCDAAVVVALRVVVVEIFATARQRGRERLSGDEAEIAGPIVALLSPFALNIIMYNTNSI